MSKDRINWINEITKESQGIKEQWGGVKHIATDWKPKRYAKRDRNGNTVNMGQRADATKEYLAKDQWGIQSKQQTEKSNR